MFNKYSKFSLNLALSTCFILEFETKLPNTQNVFSPIRFFTSIRQLYWLKILNFFFKIYQLSLHFHLNLIEPSILLRLTIACVFSSFFVVFFENKGSDKTFTCDTIYDNILIKLFVKSFLIYKRV